MIMTNRKKYAGNDNIMPIKIDGTSVECMPETTFLGIVLDNRLTFKSHSKASNLAVYGELGRYPMFIDQIIACLKYLNYIENETKNKFLIEFYNNLAADRKLATNCTLIN